MTVNLAYLAAPVRGGWPTYTAHLAHGAATFDTDVRLFRLGKRTEQQQRAFGRGLTYRNVSLDYLLTLARIGELHITAADALHAQPVAELLAAGATITVHDPTELKGALGSALGNARKPIVVIRETMLEHLPDRARYVPHPYLRKPNLTRNPAQHAVAYSRLDWDKGTHHIVAANLLLPPTRQITMHGAENRLYTHHKLTSVDPKWRRNYCGPWPTDKLWAGAVLAAGAHCVVDMSTIKGDGGGTQYTFLEALDGGAPLILHKGWRVGRELDAVAVFVDPDTLGAVLNAGPATLPALNKGAAATLLKHHDAGVRAKETLEP